VVYTPEFTGAFAVQRPNIIILQHVREWTGTSQLMCGFAAVMTPARTVTDIDVVRRMADTMVHRGPDDTGLYARDNVAFGFRRLSILDLTSGGHQPFLSEDGQVALVFNGEIYNYAELRRELAGLGHAFHSTGDTEVLLHAYLEWGEQCVDRLNGMWAFLVHDGRTGEVFGARDRFGIKPFYYVRTTDSWYFASEIKALHAVVPASLEIDTARVATFIASGRLENAPAGDTSFFTNVRQVPPGTCFTLSRAGNLRSRSYWCLPEEDAVELPDTAREYRDLFTSAVELRLRSDVPVGVSLSGGMDSTAIISTMAALRRGGGHASISTLHAFSYMPPEFDETPFIERTIAATGATLHRVEIRPHDFWHNLGTLLAYHDEPVHSATASISFEIYRAAAREGVKVVLCGQGADETLGGYYSFFRNWWYTQLRSGRLAAVFGNIRDYARGHEMSIVRESIATGLRLGLNLAGRTTLYRSTMKKRRLATAYPYRALLGPDARRALAAPAVLDDQTLRGVLTHSTEVSPLPLYLRLEDRNSMAHSVEARLPFLDYRLVSLAFRLGGHWKIRGEWNKYILRQSMRGVIPEEVRIRVDKMGFPTAMDRWLRVELRQELADILESSEFRQRGLFDPAAVRTMLKQHVSGERNAGSALFNLAQVELWLRTMHERSRSTSPSSGLLVSNVSHSAGGSA
jgi:asparagine synthase (glutamine-hydrolysing)